MMLTIPPGLVTSGRAGTGTTDPLFSFVKLGINFDGTNGQTTAVDFSASNKPLTFQGNAVLSTAQSTNGANASLLLDGNGDYVEAPDSADWAVGVNVDFCWEWVVRPRIDYASNTDLMSQANGAGNYPWRIYRASGANGGVGVLAINTGNTQVVNFANGSLQPAVWQHVAVVRESGLWRLYIGGVQIVAPTNVAVALFDSPGTWKLGAFAPPNATQWDGSIQQVRYTLGNARYPGGTTFNVPTSAFPTS